MKKYLYIAIAAATFASCSQDEVMEVAEKQTIQFGNTFVGNSTRAVDPSYSSNTIQSFQLFGTVNNVSIYNDVKVENKTAADANDDAGYNKVWYCPVTQYWIEGASYKFVAIVDGDKKNVTETTIVNGMPTSISYTADGVTDLLCQTVTRNNNTDYSTVGFTFNHLLSKVKFTVENTTPKATKFQHEITGIKISNAYSANTYNVTADTWGTTPTAATSGQSFDNIVVANNASSDSPVTTDSANEKLLIPGLTSVTVEFTHTLYYLSTNEQGEQVKEKVTETAYTGDKALTASIKNGMLANNSYNFKFSVSVGSTIQFTVTQAPTWTTAPDQPVTVQ